MKYTEPLQPSEALEPVQPPPTAAPQAPEPPTPLSVRLAQLTLKRGDDKAVSEPPKDPDVD